jgi:hypothetical protein
VRVSNMKMFNMWPLGDKMKEDEDEIWQWVERDTTDMFMGRQIKTEEAVTSQHHLVEMSMDCEDSVLSECQINTIL